MKAMTCTVTIRRARRDDVGVIVAMLADDPLGSARERLEDPLPPSYFRAFEALEADPNIHLMVAQDGEGAVVGCLQLCILPGLSSQGASRGLLEDVRVVIAAAAASANRWCNGRSARRRREAASSSSCLRITRVSTHSASTSGLALRAAMSA